VTISSGSLSPLSDDEDEIKLNRLFKKKASPEKIESDQDEEESRVNKTLKVKSPSKNQRADRTLGRKRKREILHEKGGCPFTQLNANFIYLLRNIFIY
jgi:hypothetical protein